MKTLTILLLLLPHVFAKPGKDEWVFKKEKDGINIYSRHSDLSKFNDLKIEMDLPGNVSLLSAILLDVEKYPEWAYGTKSAVLVKKINQHESIYYSEIGVPWPMSDRDFYADLKVTLNTEEGSLSVVSVGMKDYQPEKKNLVRIPMSNGNWTITTKSENSMHLQYILEVDPGGSIPTWIMNMFATKGPMETFANLKRRLEGMRR